MIDRKAVYEKLGGHCAYCGVEIQYKDMQVDHIVAKNKGGDDVFENLNPACRSCNHYKSTLSIEDFRAELEKMPMRLLRDSITFKNALRYGLVSMGLTKITFYFERMKE